MQRETAQMSQFVLFRICSLEWSKWFISYFTWWPSFNPSCVSFELYLDISKTNILTKIPGNLVASRVYIRFFYNLTWWPSFKSTRPSFELYKEIIKKQADQVLWRHEKYINHDHKKWRQSYTKERQQSITISHLVHGAYRRAKNKDLFIEKCRWQYLGILNTYIYNII